MSHFSPLLLVALLLLAAAFFAAAETALFSLSPIERRRVQARHPGAGKIVAHLLDLPRRTLVSILIGNNVVHILASAVVSMLAIEWWGERGVALAIAFLTVLILILGEVIPKTIAVRNNEAISTLAAYPLHYFAKLIKPLRRMVKGTTDWALSVLIRDPAKPSDKISEKELQALVQIVQEEGVLDQDEGKRLERLFELEERSVREIMTPRTDLIAFDIQENRDELTRTLKNYHYTHVPVYQHSIDQIVGVVSTQELMLFPEKSVHDLLKPPYYIPETKRIDELLFEMKKTKVHFAVCVDEYGGTAGLVTLEDVVEEIFGEIYDEYAKRETEVVKIAKDEYLVDGKIPLKHFSELVGVELESEASETLSGYLLEVAGRIPKLKETIRLQNLVFEIREVNRQRISKICVRKLS